MKQIDHVAINDISSTACRIRIPVTAIHNEFSDFFMQGGIECPDQTNIYLTVPNFNSDNSSLTLLTFLNLQIHSIFLFDKYV